MQKIFGLDLGVSSIGWAVVEHDPENQKPESIIKCGVRIVPLDSKETDEFQKGGNVPTNVARRVARGARRNLQRFKLRRNALYGALKRLGMMPDRRLMDGLPPKELFALREKALSEKLSLPEIGRAIIHLNLRRGYKSSRKNRDQEEDGKKSSQYLEEIRQRETRLDSENLTIGQSFSRELSVSPDCRVRQKIFNRDTYIEEFDKIWDKQSSYYPEILTAANRKLIRDKILYWQRPLKSAKGLVGECTLEYSYALDKETHDRIILPNGQPKIVRPKCAPKSSPLAQECKVWESIHNLRVYDESGMEFPLTANHKQQIFDVLQLEEKNLTASKLLKILKLSPSMYSVDNLVREKGLESNRTRAKLLSIFQKTGIQRRDLLKFDPEVEILEWDNPATGEKINRPQLKGNFDREPLYELWHLIYATEEESDLVRILMERYGFTKTQATALAEIDFTKEGYSNKSHRAMRRLLPHYRDGKDYTKACEAAGYNHSQSLTKEENAARTLSPKLEVVPKNSLRNPVVEKILNQMIHVVNELVVEYGRPDIIRVELARPLKQSAKARAGVDKRNRERERDNKKIRELIAADLHIQPESVTKVMIEKWKLWEEVDGISIYTGKKIERASLLRGELVDIEHIIPKIRRFDDSFENKTICERTLNQEKSKSTAFDFMKSQSVGGLQSFEAYLRMVKDLYEKKSISESKRNRFLMSAEDLDKDGDFLSRQLKDTQQIARKAREILSEICFDVQSSSGGITDFLRHQWGWDEVIENLRLPQFRELGLTTLIKIRKGTQDKEIIKDWDKRKDHRHHALDALVVACTSRAHIQRLNRLNQTLDGKEGESTREMLMKLGRDKFLAGKAPFSFNEISSAIQSVLISFKQSVSVATKSRNRIKGIPKEKQQVVLTPRGALHKETIYGRIRRYAEKLTPLNSRFSPDMVARIAHEHQRQLVEKRLEQFGGDPKIAFKNLEANPILYGANNAKRLTRVTLWEDWYVARESISTGTTANKIDHIVDGAARKAIQERFAQTKDPKKAFDKLAENPIIVNNKRVKSVRILNPAEQMIQLPRGYAKSDGNHHVAIYMDADGKKQEQVVRFRDAFQRVSLGLPPIIKDVGAAYDRVAQMGDKAPEDLILPPDPAWQFICSLSINDMFLFDIDPQVIDILNPEAQKMISKHLFRVRKLSSGQYWFLHHLETQILEDTLSKKGGRCKWCSMNSMRGAIKVRLNRLGNIVSFEPPVV